MVVAFTKYVSTIPAVAAPTTGNTVSLSTIYTGLNMTFVAKSMSSIRTRIANGSGSISFGDIIKANKTQYDNQDNIRTYSPVILWADQGSGNRTQYAGTTLITDNIGNDSTSQIVVGPYMYITVYQNGGYGGSSLTLYGPTNPLTYDPNYKILSSDRFVYSFVNWSELAPYEATNPTGNLTRKNGIVNYLVTNRGFNNITSSWIVGQLDYDTSSIPAPVYTA